jgi:glutathione S-transferase
MIEFYYGSGSPWAWRVQLVLEEKGLAYDKKMLSFGAGDQKKPEYLAMNPHGKVPVLTDGDVTLYESQAILEYLEEAYPKPAMLPVGAGARARVRIEEIECTIYLNDAFRGLAQIVFFTPEEKRDPKTLAERRADVRAEIVRLDRRAAGRGGDFVMGPTLSRADTTWIPFIEIAGRAGVAIDPAATPWVAAWQQRVRSRRSYQNSYPPHWRKS